MGMVIAFGETNKLVKLILKNNCEKNVSTKLLTIDLILEWRMHFLSGEHGGQHIFKMESLV